MTEQSTVQRPTAANRCPWWCDGVGAGHETDDGDHYSEGRSIPVMSQLNGETTEPNVLVALHQRIEDARTYQPLVHVVGGASNEMTPDQARQLVVLVADQLAGLDPSLTYLDKRTDDCPPWCITAGMHDDETERQAHEGGALHWSRRLPGAGRTAVQVAVVTDADGVASSDYPLIHVGDETLTAAETRALALDLLHAAALADIADGLAVRQ